MGSKGMIEMTRTEILKNYFGYDSFRKGQEEIIDEILKGRDALGIMPTGAGKSLCFQVPAMAMEGITLVVSPLISLMQDQVKALMQSGIRAAYINSALTAKQIDMALYNAKQGMYKIIYVAPERLLTENFLDFALHTKIAMLTVDEAHCISQWGQDFRPSYGQIPAFIEKLPQRPVVSAFTATATEQVKLDIVRLLQLYYPLVLVSGFDRENLYFEVKESRDKIGDLLHFLEDKKDKSGIVYCATRKAVEGVSEKLMEEGFSARKYHGGMGQEERKENQEAFIFDTVKIMVATNAFGMGIDKSNVNFVVHYNMPKDMESYYQEAGRGGRDGSPAHCLMLYSGQDVVTNQFLIESSRDMRYENQEMEKKLKNLAYKRLKEIDFYAKTNTCLRSYILQYFGDESAEFCGNCSNCNASFTQIDATEEARKIIDCVIQSRERFGKVMIIDILKGSKNKKLLDFGFQKLSCYGSSKESSTRLRSILDALIYEGYLVQLNSQYATIQTGEKARDLLENRVKFEMKVALEREKKEERARISKDRGIPEGRETLFDDLRLLRAKFAGEQEVPAFVIFGDVTLLDMCQKLPQDDEAFLAISGVGQSKLEKYGREFTSLIRSYCAENGISTEEKPEKTKRKSSKKTGELILPTEEMLTQVERLDEAIPVSMITSNINAMLDYYACTRISAMKLNNWLQNEGYLKTIATERGNTKVPTEKALASGVVTEEKIGKDYSYEINLYPKAMQDFVIKNVIQILKGAW